MVLVKMKNISALIICAGLSQRMGSIKSLIEYQGTPFLALIIKKCASVCKDIIVVTGYESEYVQRKISCWIQKDSPDLLRNIKWSHNADFQKGMLTSLQKGLREAKKTDWLLYHFVDQPVIPQEFYHELIQQADNDFEWIQPVYNGQNGHPLLFSQTLITRILGISPKQSLRVISKDKKLKKKLWPCAFPEILDDYDTPQQLQQLMGND